MLRKSLSLFVYSIIVILSAKAESSSTIKGLVINKAKHSRLAKVFIANKTAKIGVFNNLRGEYSIEGQEKDTLIAQLPGFIPDTQIVHKDQTVIVFSLKPNGITLPEIIVKEKKDPAQEWKKKTIKENKTRLERIENTDLISVSPYSKMAGLSIDALYNAFSKDGEDLRKWQELVEYEFEQQVIDSRFTKDLVQRSTLLPNNLLWDFMQQYRPTYDFIKTTNDYDLVVYIKKAYRRYLLSPSAYRLPKLKTE